MELFEYITVAVSIVLSLSIVRSLEAFGHVFDPTRRYSLHAVWFCLKLGQPLLLWWSIWSLHDQKGWNFLAFVLCVVAPAVLFLQVSTLVSSRPETVTDWRQQFYACRKRFFGANIVMAVSGPLLLVALGAREAAGIVALGCAGDVLTSTIAIISANPRVQWAVVFTTAIGFLIWSILLFQPSGPMTF